MNRFNYFDAEFVSWLAMNALISVVLVRLMRKEMKRERYPMPDDIKRALEENGIMKDYYERPAYQQNDYIGWIERAKRQETKEKRLAQMLDELKAGGIYMKMTHPASVKK